MTSFILYIRCALYGIVHSMAPYSMCASYTLWNCKFVGIMYSITSALYAIIHSVPSYSLRHRTHYLFTVNSMAYYTLWHLTIYGIVHSMCVVRSMASYELYGDARSIAWIFFFLFYTLENENISIFPKFDKTSTVDKL